MGLFKKRTKRILEKEESLRKRAEAIKKKKQELEMLNLEIDKAKKKSTIEFKRFDVLEKKKIKKLLINEKKAMLINMQMPNGFVDSFLVSIGKDKSFQYEKGTYIIDEKFRYWHISSKYYALDYHLNFPLPIKREFDVDKINNAIQESGDYEIDLATNPSLIRQFLMSNIIEQVIKGAELSKWLQALRLMVLVILVISAVNFIILLTKSGILQNVKP